MGKKGNARATTMLKVCGEKNDALMVGSDSVILLGSKAPVTGVSALSPLYLTVTHVKAPSALPTPRRQSDTRFTESQMRTFKYYKSKSCERACDN